MRVIYILKCIDFTECLIVISGMGGLKDYDTYRCQNKSNHS